MAQILLPASDLSTGSWSATPLWSKVDDDSTVNASGDGTTISSDNNTSPDSASFSLTTGTDPSSSTDHILRARWNKDASGGHQINAVLELWQDGGSSAIATLTETNIGNTEVESTYTLSAAEADAITDYTALQLVVSRQGDSGGNPNGRRSLVVDLVELEIPDASTAKQATGSSSLALTSGSAATQRTAKATGTSGVVLTTPSASAKATRKATGSSSLAATGGTATTQRTAKGTGSTAIVVTSSGQAQIPSGAKTATGTSSLSLSSSGVPQRTAKAAGASSLTLTVTGTPHRTAKGVGSSALVISASGATHRTAKATGSSDLVLTSSGRGDNASVESTFGDLRTVQVNYQGIW